MKLYIHILINLFIQLSFSTGACPFIRPRSSSVDHLVESSFSVEPRISSPSKTCRNKEYGQSEEASYLVIGGGGERKEEDYANYQSEDNGVNRSKNVFAGTEKNCLVSPSANDKMTSDKPETSSNSTTFTVAPSVSSSSSSAPSSVAPLSPVSMDCDLKSPNSLCDSTISRLIDAVSLGNEPDSRGSISALIGQFDSTVDQNDFATLSHDYPPFHHSDLRPTTPKVLQDLKSPLKTNIASVNKKQLTSSQQVAQITNHINDKILSPCKVSQTDAPAPAIFSSPETAELEEVYTILDEEVLLPVSVYNLKKQTVHVQADTMESMPSKNLGSCPAQAVHDLGKGHNIGWDDVPRKRGVSEDTEEVEESVYEEVYDPPAPAPVTPDIEWSTSRRYLSSSVNGSFQFLHNSVRNTFVEREINVDEDPLDMMTSLRHDGQWEGLPSPTKRHAIYQNHESTPNYSHQKQPSSYHDPPQRYPSHVSPVARSQCHSPMSQPFYQLSSHHQQHSNPQPSPYHRPVNSRSSNPSPQCQNSYSVPQGISKAPINSRDSSNSHTQQWGHRGSQSQNRPEYTQMEREQVRHFHKGFSSSESLPGQSVGSINMCRDRGLYSPSSDCDAVYSHLDYDCVTPISNLPINTQPHSQSETQSHTTKQSCNQKVPLINCRQRSQPETTVSLHLSTQSASMDSTGASQCKSKSLGDLTSEDISCNFQSKYHIISRSFITPHMRKQKRMGTMGEVTFQSQSCDPLTEQLRKLVSLEGDDSDRDRAQSPQSCHEAKSPLSQPQTTTTAPVIPRDTDDSPPPLTRRLSSRSQSRVRHINSRARERQQEALKPRAGMVINNTTGIGGVVLRNKPASQNPPANRHSTGSYIAGYLGQLEDRGLPEGACTSLRYGNGDHYGDRYYTDDSLPNTNSIHSESEPEVYFLLRL